MEAELARTKDELTSILQQQSEVTAAEMKTCPTQTEADDEMVELREQLQKSVESLSSKQNEVDLLQQQLQSQLSEIDDLQHALTDKVLTCSVHTHHMQAMHSDASLKVPEFFPSSFKVLGSHGTSLVFLSPGNCMILCHRVLR